MSPNNKPQIIEKSGRLLMVAGGGLLFILTIAYFFYALQPSFSEKQVVKFKISRGESFRSIGARLMDEQLIKSLSVFKFYSIIKGRAQNFQPGIYELSSSMSVPQIISLLTEGGNNEVMVVVPEGVTVKDVDEILSKAGVVEKGELFQYRIEELAMKYPFLQGITSLEGFLFPDTYRFERDSSLEEVLSRFLDNFQMKAWSLLDGRKNWYDSLILASYLEREVPDYNDRLVVAGILLKRLKIGMPLQVDATLSYAKCNGRFLYCDKTQITMSDLNFASPYNTYQRLGWTPTPIANPGQAAIKASLTPENSSYLFYLSASTTKETIFSKTLQEHNRNRVKHL